MRIRIKMNAKTIYFMVIIIICIFSLSYGIYYQVYNYKNKNVNETLDPSENLKYTELSELFDNKLNANSNQVR